MQLEGENVLDAPIEQVWAALNDPDVLARCVPGVKALVPSGPDAYDAQIQLAVGPLKGNFKGKVSITDKVPLEAISPTAGEFATQPSSASSWASRYTNGRKPTPWTCPSQKACRFSSLIRIPLPGPPGHLVRHGNPATRRQSYFYIPGILCAPNKKIDTHMQQGADFRS